MDFAGPIEDVYYLIVVDSYTKWPEVLRCKRPTTGVAITFLHELFARFGVADCLVQRTGGTFRRHSEESSKENLRNTLRKGFTTVLTGSPNHTDPDAISPAETMFARKIRPVFEKLLPKQASLGRTMTVPTK